MKIVLLVGATAFLTAFGCGPIKIGQLIAADDAALAIELRAQIIPLLQEHCLDCHSGSEADAGLSLDHFDTPLSFLKGRSVWKKAIQKLQINEMPPPDVTQMTDQERATLMNWLSTTIDDFECGLTPNPGSVTLRRLNATEYKNTIRDLLGVNYTPAAKFPGDDVGYGFDNIGDVLTLPPILMEKYLLAAEKISRHVIQTPPAPKQMSWDFTGAQLETNKKPYVHGNNLTLVSNSAAGFNEQIPWAGTYTLTITASGDQALNEPCLMGVAVDGKVVRRIAVANSDDAPKDYVIPLRLGPGSRAIGIRFLNDYNQKAQGGRPALDRNLHLHHVTLVGTKKSTEGVDDTKLTRQHKKIIFTTPSTDAKQAPATRKVLSRLASRAFRRPVDAGDLDRLVVLATSVQEDGGSFEESIQVGLQAILISPKFLFRVEPPSGGSGLESYRDLDDFELASRLSYFLFSSMPDDELFALANRGELRKSGNMRKQIARMLRDKRSNSFVVNFASQWLTLRRINDFQPNPKLFPKWNDQIAGLAIRETMTFFSDVVRNDMSVLRLLDGNFTWLNEELADYYDIPGVKGKAFVRVSLKDTPRAGLLTQASILAVTSNPTRTSPVKRGKWILDNLLATPPPPAPAGVPELKEKGQLVGTMRQQLEQHRKNPACASCHKLMDPLGFALENFDAIGLYRATERGAPIDASGVLPSGVRVDGAAQLRNVLVKQNKEQFIRCFTEKMLTFALGRGLEYYDKCAVDKIVDSLKESDYKFSELLAAIVQSEPFTKMGQREIQ